MTPPPLEPHNHKHVGGTNCQPHRPSTSPSYKYNGGGGQGRRLLNWRTYLPLNNIIVICKTKGGAEFDPQTPSQRFSKFTNAQMVLLVYSAHKNIFENFFTVRQGGGRSGHKFLCRWNLEQCREGGQNHDLSNFFRGQIFIFSVFNKFYMVSSFLDATNSTVLSISPSEIYNFRVSSILGV